MALKEGALRDMRDYKIFAVDFDGTLAVNEFPDIGRPNKDLIKYLIKRKKAGDKIILWTCRVDHWLQEAVDWCKAQGLEFDEVNNNLPEKIEKWGNDTRKIYADIYIDDKAVVPQMYTQPYGVKPGTENFMQSWLQSAT